MESDPIYWPSFFFLLFGAVACAFAIAVVVSTNIVRSALYLVMSLAGTAGLFFVAGADFVGSMQLLIYVGGTLVLLIFGVMLTSQERFVSMKTSKFELALAGGVGACLFLLLLFAATSVPEWRGIPLEDALAQPILPTATPIGLGLLGARVDAEGAPDRAGYLLVFEIISVHLLVVLVGAAYLARASRKRGTVLE